MTYECAPDPTRPRRRPWWPYYRSLDQIINACRRAHGSAKLGSIRHGEIHTADGQPPRVIGRFRSARRRGYYGLVLETPETPETLEQPHASA